MSAMKLEQFLDAAIAVAQATAALHRSDRVHLGLRPGNLRIGADGAAELLSPGSGESVDGAPSVRAGWRLEADALPYISPEQTGRMNRPVDQRSDLYSLGVTLYEWLTGAPPFHAEDVLGWLHCHIARPPRSLAEAAPEVPRALADIVHKLLSKMAEDRYQTAAGLQQDLERCREQWRARGEIEPFPLGARDVSDRLRISARLYGREQETAALLAALERVVATGAPELVTVAGYSGIGKSSLVQEMHKPLARERGFFLSGKFDQLSRDIPYATIGRAFRDLTQYLLTEGEAELDVWRPRLAAALGANGQLVLDVIPQLELIVGPAAPVAPLPLQEAQARLMAVFQRFIGVFTRREHPLVLFLDDLQWADMATLELLRHVVLHPDTRHLLVIAAYRDNEVGPSHPLVATLAAVRQGGGRVTAVSLGPLPAGQLAQLVADSVHCTRARAEPLARLLAEKTGGNPLFVTQFLSEMAHERLLRFDAEASAWQWDLAEIEAQKYTDNVVELLVGRMRRLAAPTQALLTLAACVGNEVDLALLAAAAVRGEAAVRGDLAPAVAEGLLLLRGGTYTFLHDRVQQAAYSLLPEARLAETHLRIGRLLEARSGDGEAELFDLVQHMNRGAAQIEAGAPRLRLAGLNLRAGRKAKASAAYRSAANYLAAGVALLPAASWATDYALTLALHSELAECEFASGDFEETERQCALIAEHGASTLDKTPVYVLRMKMCVATMDNKQGIAWGVEGLALFGVHLPSEPDEDAAAAAIEALRGRLRGRRIEDLLELPTMVNREMEAVMELLATLIAPTVYTSPNLWNLMICMLVDISIEHGNGPASSLAYATLGANFCGELGEFTEGYRFGKLAYDLAERQGKLAVLAEVCNVHGCLIAYWSQPIGMCVDLCRIGLRAALESGNIPYACYLYVQLAEAVLMRGDSLESVDAAAAAAEEYCRNAKFAYLLDIVAGIRQLTRAMQGLTAGLASFSDEGFAQAEFEAKLLQGGLPIVVCWYFILVLQTQVLAGDSRGALAAAAHAKAHLWGVTNSNILSEYHYYAGLAAAMAFDAAADDAERAAQREALELHVAKQAVWARSCPVNFRGRHALAAAELARIEGRDDDAAQHYYQAIQGSRAGGFIHNEALSNELAARFFRARGMEPVAVGFLRAALRGYAAWGAHGKVRALERLEPELAPTGGVAPASGRHGRPDELDAQVAIQASQALSGELVLDALLATLLRLVLEHAGADRCCLLLVRGQETITAAEGKVGEVGVALQVAAPGASLGGVPLPTALVNYVKRTREAVLMDDAALHPVFAADEYIARGGPRSALCMPISRNGALVAILYLENRLVVGAFAARSLALLDLLASQTAISLENAGLYAELGRAEQRLRRLIETANVLPWEADAAAGRFTYVGPQTASILGYAPQTWTEGPARAFLGAHVHPEDLARVVPLFLAAGDATDREDREFRMIAADGRVVWLYNALRAGHQDGGGTALSGFLFDITERKRVEAALAEKLAIIEQQQSAIQELSTPIIEVWEGVLTMPLFGRVDRVRAARMMDVLLSEVTRTGCRTAIVDLTGVSDVDISTAEHIIRLIRAVELLGARGIVVGIRPALARTLVAAGIDLGAIPTPANLREALLMCMRGPPPRARR